MDIMTQLKMHKALVTSATKYKNLLFIFGLLLSLISCKSYERSTDTGMIVSTDMTEIYEMIENKETFVMAITQSFCSHCEDFKQNVLIDYLEDHHVIFYDVVADKLDSYDSVINFVKKNPNPDKFVTSEDKYQLLTPTFYYIVDGEVEEIWVGTMDENQFNKLIERYQIDRK